MSQIARQEAQRCSRCFVLAALCTGSFAWAQTSPYTGQEQRAIKSISEQEVAGLLEGAGAGFARAAELNGYPGPMHVLELADGLALSAEQRAATQSLMAQHKAHCAQARQMADPLPYLSSHDQ